MTEGQRERIEEYLKMLEAEPPLYQTAEKLVSACETDFAQAVYDTVFAPVLVCFVEWVIEEAQNRGIERLYFLARDGYQMYLTAKHLCQIEKIEIECRYLYGSRYAWRIPQFALEGEKCLEAICRGGIDVTFEKVMKRGKLTDEEAFAVAEELGFTERYQSVLTYNEVMQLKQPLKESKLFLPYVYEHSRKTYTDTLGYLKQEGLLDEAKYALVDSGWTGSLQQTLQQLLQKTGCEKHFEGFYFGLYELPAGVKKDSYHAYYFGPKEGIKRKVYFSNCLFESVYSAPYGMTVGYEKKDGRYVPVFYRESNLNQTRMEQTVKWLERYLLEYGKYRTDSPGGTGKEEAIQTVSRLLGTLMGTPTREEAEAYGTLLFSDDVTEDYMQEVAATLTTEEIKNQRFLNKACIMLGLKKGKLHDSAWQEGSVVKNEIQVKSNLRHAVIYKYFVYIRKAFRK